MAETLSHAPSVDSRPAQSPLFYRALHDITGRRFAYTWFRNLWSGAIPAWIENVIAERFDCDPDDVRFHEDDNGQEMVVVDRNPVAFIITREGWLEDER